MEKKTFKFTHKKFLVNKYPSFYKRKIIVEHTQKKRDKIHVIVLKNEKEEADEKKETKQSKVEKKVLIIIDIYLYICI